MTASTLRYQLPKKAIKGDCPQCGPRHRRTLSRYVDTRTNELLPEQYGRCDRESNCGYHVSPYHKTASGTSYANELYEQWKAENSTVSNSNCRIRIGNTGSSYQQLKQVNECQSAVNSTHTIPDAIFASSLKHSDRNQFVYLLRLHFGKSLTDELVQRFQIGTSSYWPGATVFWILDEQQRVRSGQVVLFANDWHKAKYTDREGRIKPCISSVSHGLLRRYRKVGTTPPPWLIDYHGQAPRWPCLFGLNQLATAPTDQPVAIVEAPKTAIVCSPYFPRFIWLAVGALSYLNAERLAAVRNRSIVLCPDLSKGGSAFDRWSRIAEQLRAEGFNVAVSDYLEKRAVTDQQREQGLDLADWLLDEWRGYPPDWDNKQAFR